MANLPPDPSASPGGSLSPLPGALQSSRPTDEPDGEDLMPSWDVQPPTAVPVAQPIDGEGTDVPVALPVGTPVSAEPVPTASPVENEAEAPILAEPVDEAPPVAAVVEEPSAPAVAPMEDFTPPTHLTCPACGTSCPLAHEYCSDCGYYFSDRDRAAALSGPAGAPTATPVTVASAAGMRVQDRYELVEMVCDRLGVQRFNALDHGDGNGPAIPVVLIRQLLPETPPPAEPIEEQPIEDVSDEIMPTFDDLAVTGFPATEILSGQPQWPSIGWERKLLYTLEHPALPVEKDYLTDDTYEYLVLEAPTGQLLWDAWDDPNASNQQKFGYLVEVAETLHRLHQCNAMLEGLRPDIVLVGDDGHVRFKDLSDLLPLPLPGETPVRGTLYTAPEVVSGQGMADARADLYSFGAMLYALHVGRELNERTDFDGPGNPKPFIPRFPDCHPAFGRLMMKTFRKEVEARFPTDEAGREDSTGFLELIRTLETLRRTFDVVRLEIAAWTNTGIIRTGNEDAFALLHACESRQEDLGEAALVLLCDGMGGYEAGEVAAALTIQTLREQLSKIPPFSIAAGASAFATDPLHDWSRPEGHSGPRIDPDACKQAIKTALRDANTKVFQTSRAPGSKRRGMGCTAEVVYVDGRDVVVGHVGDSRTYHLHEGRLVQLTRDQTLVNRLVELGTLSAEEAETHPRRNELQQAIGGQPTVEPGLYHGRMSPGDWVVVCSDGLTNHVNSRDLQQMLQSEASSAEMCARRLVNLTLIEGATDNVTVVVIRAT